MNRSRRGFLPRLGRLLPKSRWLRLALIAVPIVFLLAAVDPLLGLVAMGGSGLGAVFGPLLDAPYGRLALAIAAVGTTMWIVARTWGAPLRTLRARALLHRHLAGIAAVLQDDPRRAQRLLEGVACARGPFPTEFPSLREDACLKLARLALDAGAPARAQAWLLRVPEADLSPALARSHAQLRALIELATPGALPASVDRVVREALARFPDDLVLLGALRDVRTAQGATAEAATVQDRVARACRDPAARTRLASLWLEAAAKAWAASDEAATHAHLAAARTADPMLAAEDLLAVEICVRQGDVRGALRGSCRVPGPRGLTRAAELLAAMPHDLTPREVLEICPTQGGLLLAAQVYAQRGDAARAHRATRLAARAMPDSPTAAAAIAAVQRRIEALASNDHGRAATP